MTLLEALEKAQEAEEYEDAARLLMPAIFKRCLKLLRLAPDPYTAAEDACQEILLKIWWAIMPDSGFVRMPTPNPNRSAWQWVHTITMRHCLDIIKRQSKNWTQVLDVDFLPDDKESEPRQRCQAREFITCLSTLPPTMRDVVILRYQGDNTYRQIAEILGISKSRANELLNKALEQLGRALRHTRANS